MVWLELALLGPFEATLCGEPVGALILGRIADRGTVTVLHPSGVRSTSEPVEPAVTVGEVVAQGSRLGELAGTGSHCRPTCLHLGAVRDHTYLDPLVFLTGGRRVRLLPLDQAPDG